jgi:hypothetical protein
LDSGGATTVLLVSTFGRTFNRAFETALAAGFAFNTRDLAPFECRLGAFFVDLVLGFAFVAMIRASSVETAELIKVVVVKVKRPTPPLEEQLL